MIISQRLVALEPEVIRHTLQVWKTKRPHMGVLALLPEAEKHRVSTLQQVCSEEQVPVCGAIFPALVSTQGFATSGAWLIYCDPMPPCFLLADLPQCGPQALIGHAKALLATTAADTLSTLFLMFDGMLPNISTLMDTLHGAMEAPVMYAGVSAGSETFTPMPCLFDGKDLVGSGVLGLLLPPDARALLRHGYPTSQKLMQATSGVRNRIDTIDNRPAFEVYQAVIAQEYGVTLTRENFYDHAVHFPFGVVTAMDVLVRIPVGFTDDGALVCVGEVPPHSMLRLLRAPSLEESSCVERLAQGMEDMGMSAANRSLLTFYCAGRRMHFGDAAGHELQKLRAVTGASSLHGALSLGEIDSMDDLNLPRFHNAALLCIPARNSL